MAKLFASESAQTVARQALDLHGEAGQLSTFSVERHYRDTPLMIIGEGTNEIQRTIIARQLLERYGERMGALTSREGESDDRRHLLLAVRQFVDKTVAARAPETDASHHDLILSLAELGVLGAPLAPAQGGLGLDLETCGMMIEELARGSAALAGAVVAHFAAAHVLARFGTGPQRNQFLAAMTRADVLGSVAFAHARVTAGRDGGSWQLTGNVAFVENATHATLFLVAADHEGARSCFLVERDSPGLEVAPAPPVLGARGLDLCDVRLDRARVHAGALVGGALGGLAAHCAAAGTIARLGIAATAVGVAQAAFEASLRYSQQRSAFGKPICQHQAVQLKLADMATAITAARLLTYDGARRVDRDGDDTGARLAKLFASDIAPDVTLDAMRIHGGYGYTTEFPVERYYRDATRLAAALGGNDHERRVLARRLRDAA
jgi:alkylation response protein AidB-like acyl-CoA dehydrogenase